MKKEYERISIVCTSPSKTFNLAGLVISNIFIPDRGLRAKFEKELNRTGFSQHGIMGLAACEAAYGKGGEWYRAMVSYLSDNLAFVQAYVRERLPGVSMAEHEATYLAWLDFRGLGLDADELDWRIVHRAKLWLDRGAMFGACGRGFQRINAACPRSVLAEALQRLEKLCREAGPSR